MRQFKDLKGRAWDITITVGDVARVKGAIGVDLNKAAGGKLIADLADDMAQFCGVLWALLEPQARAANVTPEEFGASMAGASIDAATDAFLEELVDYFPLAKRRVLAAAMASMRAETDRAVAFVEENMPREMRRLLDQKRLTLFGSLTSSEESSELTPSA